MKIELTLAELHRIFDALDVADEFVYSNDFDEDLALSPEDDANFDSAYNKIARAIQTFDGDIYV